VRGPLPRLYAILDVDVAGRYGIHPDALFEIWLDAGITLIQLRAKTITSGAMLALADRMAPRAQAAGATFIVNDRADVAAMSGAAGVHVGQDDLTPADVRRVLGPHAIVGLSTHTAAQVDAALRQPIDYVAIGPAYTTASKDRPDPEIGLAGVRMAAAAARDRAIPVVAIGGITLDRAAVVLEAGANAVAVISDLLAPDAAARARDWVRALR
jgi:thiamine-phosphate pyrophosphorylase